MSEHIFVTSAGVEIPLVRIPVMQGQMVDQATRKEAAKLYGEPVKPTYTIPTDDGGEEIHEHDEETIKDNPAAQRAWDQWQECIRKTNELVINRMIDFIILEGTDAPLPESKAWMRRQQLLGIEIPEEEPEDNSALRLHYTKSVLLRTPEDITNLQTAVMTISGMNQEALAAARATFQRHAQNGRDAGNDGGAAGSEEIQLDGEPTVQRDADGEGVGADAKPMGHRKRRR